MDDDNAGAQDGSALRPFRTVQQAILAKAPEYRAAVETLANTYEQARYLPVEQELSPEQLESARAALLQFRGKNSNG